MELSTTTLAIFAVFAVMGLVGVVAVTIMSVPEDAEARGCETGISKADGGYVGLNASQDAVSATDLFFLVLNDS